MDERAAIPPGLPRPNPTTSYWQDPPDERLCNLRSTEELPNYADYVIVGSGISGACIAWNLLNRLEGPSKPTVLMLEAREACSGATGRNGGHTKSASYRTFLSHAAHYGTSEAVKIARLEYENIFATHRLASEYNLDCESRSCTTVDVIYDAEFWLLAKESIEKIRQVVGSDDPIAGYNLLDGEKNEDEIRRRFLTPGEDQKIAGAVVYQAGSISAYKFTIGILKKCLDLGLNLQTNTPLTSFHQSLQHADDSSSPSWTIETPRGTVVASNIILATNAYTAHLLPELQGKIVPLRGQITAQARGPKLVELTPEGLQQTYLFLYPSGYEYMIPRPFMPPVPQANRGDILIGGGWAMLPNEGLEEYGNTDDTTINPKTSAYLRETLVRYFGSNWGADNSSSRVKAEWTGVMGITGDGLPYVGQVPGKEGSWVSAGFNGHGMVMCLKCAEALVHIIFGDKNELDWFPKSFEISRERLGRVKFEGRTGVKIKKPEEPEPYVVD